MANIKIDTSKLSGLLGDKPSGNAAAGADKSVERLADKQDVKASVRTIKIADLRGDAGKTKDKPAATVRLNVSSLAKALMNDRPEAVVQAAQKELDKQDKQQPIAVMPRLSLKALIDLQANKSKVAALGEADDTRYATVEMPYANPLLYGFNERAQNETALAPFVHSGELFAPGDLTFDESQKAAIRGLLENKFSCLIGKAGTGKTTVLNRLLEILRDMGMTELLKYRYVDVEEGEVVTYKPAVFVGAFMGRAVEQVKKRLPTEYHASCGTIHGDKCLAYQPSFYEEFDPKTNRIRNKVQFLPSFDENNKLPYKLYIIDESGMLSVELWNVLRRAMRDDARVILVGDINQLPPVYGRSILGYAMSKWPTFELTTIHRQAADNPIIKNAHRILEGLFPQPVKKRFDVVDLGAKGSQDSQTFMLRVIQKLHQQGEFDEFADAFIVPWNKRAIGKDVFNELLVPYFNPPKPDQSNRRTLIQTGQATVAFAVNDKVMLGANDKKNNLTNGQIGVIVSININGSYKDVKKSLDSMTAMHHVSIDEDEFHLTSGEFDLTDGGDQEKEEEMNERQASHIVTVRFETDITRRVESHDTGERDPVTGKRIMVSEEESKHVGREVSFSTAGEFKLLQHAYCITCHKSQGGEYPTVVILLHSANSVSLSREWLYTAVTRAKERVVLVCNSRGLQKALSIQRIKGKTLAEKIQSFVEFELMDQLVKKEEQMPNLPQPRKADMPVPSTGETNR